MPIFKDEANNIFHTEGDRTVWSTQRRPALLFPNDTITVNPFTVSFPDFAKSNAMAFAIQTTGGFDASSCLSIITINPQSWDSGLSLVANLPSQCNYFETAITLTRTKTPSTYLNLPFPDNWSSGSTHLSDGGALMEAIGPITRIFSLERVGNGLYLRRKQTVRNAGQQVGWNSGNNNSTGAGGMRNGWTYGGDPNAWLAAQRDMRNSGNIDKRRGGPNQCSLDDNTDYSSIWTGSLVITPGYIDLT